MSYLVPGLLGRCNLYYLRCKATNFLFICDGILEQDDEQTDWPTSRQIDLQADLETDFTPITTPVFQHQKNFSWLSACSEIVMSLPQYDFNHPEPCSWKCSSVLGS